VRIAPLATTDNTSMHLRLGSVRSLLMSALLFASAEPIVAARHERAVDAWQPLNYDVAITLNDDLTTITKASTKITIQILKESVAVVDLDFGEMDVDAVSVDGSAAKFDRPPGLLDVQLPKSANKGSRVVIAVEYHGKPRDGLILTADKDGKPSATGDNWPNRVHYWIPSLDHPSAKATVKFTITAPAKDLVIANGRFDGVHDDSQTTRTWTYTEGVPIPAYCMVIAVGEYAKSEPNAPAVTPLSYYVPQSDAKFALQGFAAAAPSLKFFSETVAPYPYEKLALIVGATRFGGMENSSAIVFASTLFDRPPGPPRIMRLSRTFNIPERLEDVVAHEIAHQWFGDSVTESTWADLWLSEGFATYFAGLVEQKYDGEDAFREYMQRAAQSYFAYEKTTRTPIHDTETEDLMKLLNANNYQKGAWVLHMLRMQLGDDAFFRGLRDYYNAHKNANATSDDLRAALEKASGRDLKQFFASWVFGTGHPQYEVRSDWVVPNVLRITVRQLQSEPPFPNLLPIRLTTAKGAQTVLIKPAGREAVEEFRLDGPPSSIEVDPANAILKELTVRPMM
jgi:aminopeptidase N